MRKAVLLLAAVAITTPAVAQHTGHTMPGMTMPTPAKKKPAPKKKAMKKAAPKKATAKKATPKKAAPKKAATNKPAAKPSTSPHAEHQVPAEQQDPHAGQQMPAEPAPADPHAAHQMPAEPAPADPHAGHQMPMQQADPHAGHDMGGMTGPEPQPAPPPPEALTGPKYAADAYWNPVEQQRSRNILREEHGGLPAYKLFVDRAETQVREARDGYLFDAQAWFGGDIDKLWLKSEVEGDWGKKLEHVEVQALWSHAIGPWFDLQAGVRYDPQPGPNRTHLVLGVEGLAPYWWEVEGGVFLSNKGDVTARAEGEFDLRITQKLILQPRAEVNLALQDVPELSIGSGLTDASLGLRLRYQISPLVAPYIGVEYERAFGHTRSFLRAEGEDPGGINLLSGIRLWF